MVKTLKQISPTQILFDNKLYNGKYVSSKEELIFLHQVCNISTFYYNKIFYIDDGHAGAYLLFNDCLSWIPYFPNKYRFIWCGSGLPIVSDETGTFIAL